MVNKTIFVVFFGVLIASLLVFTFFLSYYPEKITKMNPFLSLSPPPIDVKCECFYKDDLGLGPLNGFAKWNLEYNRYSTSNDPPRPKCGENTFYCDPKATCHYGYYHKIGSADYWELLGTCEWTTDGVTPHARIE